MIKTFIFMVALGFSNVALSNEPVKLEFTTEHGKPYLVVTWEKCTKAVEINEKDFAAGDADKIVRDIKDRVKCDAR